MRRLTWLVVLLWLGLGIYYFAPQVQSGLEVFLCGCRDLALAHPLGFALLFAGLGSLAVNAPLPLAAALKLSAGWLFGALPGFAVNIALSCLGGSLGFGLARRIFRDSFRAAYGHKFPSAQAELAANGFWYVLASRLCCGLPFFAVNLLAGLSSLRFGVFLAATLLGALPTSAFYALTGQELDSLARTGEFSSSRLSLFLAALACLALVPPLVSKLRGKRSPIPKNPDRAEIPQASNQDA